MRAHLKFCPRNDDRGAVQEKRSRREKGCQPLLDFGFIEWNLCSLMFRLGENGGQIVRHRESGFFPDFAVSQNLAPYFAVSKNLATSRFYGFDKYGAGFSASKNLATSRFCGFEKSEKRSIWS